MDTVCPTSATDNWRNVLCCLSVVELTHVSPVWYQLRREVSPCAPWTHIHALQTRELSRSNVQHAGAVWMLPPA